MSAADAVAVVMFVGIIAYSLFAGADFGSGIWDLTAGRGDRGADQRRLIDSAIGPVWEANHVWLIFVLVFLWTGFPTVFAAVVRTLFLPLSLVGLGIVLRGSGFAFRKFAETNRQAEVFGVLFAVSSLITPFFLGTIAGAVASGRVPIDGTGDLVSSWLSVTSLVGGVLAVLTCAFLAATFLAADAARLGRDDLAEWARRRALVSGAATGTVALAATLPLRSDAPTLFDGLTGRGLALIVCSVVAGVAGLVLLARGRLRSARYSAAVAVGSVVAGWGVGQYPWMIVDVVEIEEAAGAGATLTALLVAFGIAGVLVIPALAYLYLLTDRGRLSG